MVSIQLFFLLLLRSWWYLAKYEPSHIDNKSFQDSTDVLQVILAIQPIWVAAISCVKLSILDLYLKIFRNQTAFRISCYILMAIVVAFGIVDILLVMLICTPVSYNWDPTVMNGKCGNKIAGYISFHSTNFILDIALAILPMPILWGLQMPTKKKIELSFMFALGTLYV